MLFRSQKNLGQVVGFPERSADVRMAQYETGSRTPKADLTRTLADFFEVSTDALTVRHRPYAHPFCLGGHSWADYRGD